MKKLFYLLIIFLLGSTQLEAQSITLEQTDRSRTYTRNSENIDLNISRSNSGNTKSDSRDSDRNSSDNGLHSPSSNDFRSDFSEKYDEKNRPKKKDNPIVESMKRKYQSNHGIKQTYSLRNSVPAPKTSYSGIPFGSGENIRPVTSFNNIEKEELDYTINIFDDIKKEIAIDLKFRNEVADPIQSFLENRTGSIPQLMRNLYGERTGYDIEDLRNKQYLTEDKRKIAEDYNHFVKQMAIELYYQANEAKKSPNPEKRLIDNAIMANDVYNPGSKSLEDTDWQPITYSQEIEDNAIARAVDAINTFNTHNNNNSGFYAQIYKNKLTGEYTLAFRGSELTVGDWKNNIQQGFSAFSEQYAFAASLGECLSHSNAKINIVGHSLGGGLATVTGLKTGFPTYTYNQADISQGTVDRYMLDVGKTDNITAYYSEEELLTTLQNETRDYNMLIPLGKKVKTGSAITIEENKALTVVSEIAKATPYPLVQAVGVVATKADIIAMGDAHRMPHTEQYLRSIYGENQAKWERYNNVQLILRNNNTYSNLLINTK